MCWECFVVWFSLLGHYVPKLNHQRHWSGIRLLNWSTIRKKYVNERTSLQFCCNLCVLIWICVELTVSTADSIFMDTLITASSVLLTSITVSWLLTSLNRTTLFRYYIFQPWPAGCWEALTLGHIITSKANRPFLQINLNITTHEVCYIQRNTLFPNEL